MPEMPAPAGAGLEESRVTQTHDGSAKLWDVWVRYWPTKAEIKKGLKLGRAECVTLPGKGKHKPLPQQEAIALADRLLRKKVYQDVWTQEVL